jgi:hypothetical protein
VHTVDGYRFRLAGLPVHKWPYAWLGRSATGTPAIHWEYFVQVAEYIRLASADTRFTVSFEDGLMDVTVYRDDRLLLACEVKERSQQIGPLLDGIRAYGRELDPTAPDRGNDPLLRKAKYIARIRPPYFSLSWRSANEESSRSSTEERNLPAEGRRHPAPLLVHPWPGRSLQSRALA